MCLKPSPKIRGCRQDGERARDPEDPHGHERLKPKAEAEAPPKDETGKNELGRRVLALLTRSG